MFDIRMMSIYCPSKLLGRFLTVIDDVNTLINGLGPTPEAIYTPVMYKTLFLFTEMGEKHHLTKVDSDR
ncbi:hypothetical protein L195_g031384, partial [Trifolium pratense]